MSTQSDFSISPEGEQVYVGSASPESLKETSLQEVHDNALEFHQNLHGKLEKVSKNFVVGLIPVVGPATEVLTEADSANTALLQGVNIETGEKFTTMGERMKFVAKHDAKALWGTAKTALDVGLWAIGAGEVQALAKVAKGAEVAGKAGKGLKIIQEGGKAAGVLEKIGTKATEKVINRTVSLEAMKIGSKLHKAQKVLHGSEIGYAIASTGKHVYDMTKDPGAREYIGSQQAEWESMMANPETRKAIEDAYETSDFKHLVDQEYTHMQEDPAYAQQVLDQITEWQGKYAEANAQFELQRFHTTPA